MFNRSLFFPWEETKELKFLFLFFFQIGKAQGQYDQNDKWPHQNIPGMNFSQQSQECEKLLGMLFKDISNVCFSCTYTKAGTTQRRLVWTLNKDDTNIHDTFHVKKKKKRFT